MVDKDVVKWAVIENIVLFIVTAFLCYTISAWFVLLLSMCNSYKLKYEKENDKNS